MLTNETYGRWNGGGYYKWNATDKIWEKNTAILCDSEIGNIDWKTNVDINNDKSEADLHARDKDTYKKGKAGQTPEHKWSYSGICYADHVKN